MIELESSSLLNSRRAGNWYFRSSSSILPAQLFGKFDPASEGSRLPKLPLGPFPHVHPGSLPAARSSMCLGGGSGGGGRSCLVFGIAIGPTGRDEKGMAADRLVERCRPWLPL